MRDSLVNKVQVYRERMLQMVRLEEAAQEEQVCVWRCVCVCVCVCVCMCVCIWCGWRRQEEQVCVCRFDQIGGFGQTNTHTHAPHIFA